MAQEERSSDVSVFVLMSGQEYVFVSETESVCPQCQCICVRVCVSHTTHLIFSMPGVRANATALAAVTMASLFLASPVWTHTHTHARAYEHQGQYCTAIPGPYIHTHVYAHAHMDTHTNTHTHTHMMVSLSDLRI